MTEATGIVGEFLALKEETDADLLAMQCGDFYEFFDEDAETVADELDLKVSQKSSHGSSYPMAGVPVDDLTPYLTALVERGYRVAVADQHETEDGHERAITRVVTPGTLIETTDDDAQYLAAVVREGDGYGVAAADVTTGQFFVTSVGGEDSEGALLTELYKFDPAEVLPGPDVRADEALLDRIRERTTATLTLHAAESFAPGRARHRVREQFGDDTTESVGIDDDEAAIRAAGAVLAYVEETGQGALASVTRLQTYSGSDHVELDATTQRNLELTETMQGDRSGSLFATIDHTVTSAGGRLLSQWLVRPRRSRRELKRRQSAVAALTEAAMAREELREVLSGAYDLERLASRAASGSADAGDLLRVAETLALLPRAAEVIDGRDQLAESPLSEIVAGADRESAADLAAELDEALTDDPPGTVTQGGLFRRGYDDELDEIIEQHEAAREWIETLDQREKGRHGITHLQVDRNKTDGYYIQVGKSEADDVPDEYEPIKTLKNSERFTIPELEEKEREILRLEEQRGDLEYDLFQTLRERVADRATLLQDVGRALAELDALGSLATHAVRNDWTRPELVEGRDLDIRQGRHPVVEQTTSFVPNDLAMDDDRRFLIVTGPNMSGKSTYMRQAALITLLAQIGSFVPAESARVGLVDGIFTRVGALDELAQGRSTFMVEMQELSNILHSATDDSLVILDEVGRGTATYDGISIAWAATEYIHNQVRAKTLFATHYHELTGLADHLERVANVHVAADESDGDVTFLRTVREGPTDRSYGIHVADLAGVPDPVVDRSRDVLERLREEKAIEAKGGGSGEPVQAVFDLSSGSFQHGAAGDEGQATADERATADGGDAAEVGADGATLDPAAEAVLDQLQDLDVNETPPVELMATVQEWQAELDGDDD
ncbi:DNA mismatch repair protein MutS [Halorientalis regularis]|jgi:DNA mismatch repair protein MutS|uniref:DNA mismatch repair protein MutS n=1 Tax=Halorientalis regularis TaxID=660518 RepID=A0A1G7PVL8_9EURY|nr:DNA mismatch repair protein MutS [Halorientalis regularis]SDF90306.1 DNA mismatch repair protein MutS [Halorientalis regularis]